MDDISGPPRHDMQNASKEAATCAVHLNATNRRRRLLGQRKTTGYLAYQRGAGRLHVTGEQPLPHPARVQPGQARHPVRQAGRVGGEPFLAVQHVLQHIAGGVACVRPGVDDQPRCPLRGEDVVGVQAGAQQDLAVGGVSQCAEQRDAGPAEARIDPASGAVRRAFLLELVRLRRAHLR
jgi:hypothetical protein